MSVFNITPTQLDNWRAATQFADVMAVAVPALCDEVERLVVELANATIDRDAAREDIKTLEVMAAIRRDERDAAIARADALVSEVERMKSALESRALAASKSIVVALPDGEWWRKRAKEMAPGRYTHWMPLPSAPISGGK